MEIASVELKIAVDVDLGLQLNFASRGHVRIEAGLHNILYVGMVSGISF